MADQLKKCPSGSGGKDLQWVAGKVARKGAIMIAEEVTGVGAMRRAIQQKLIGDIAGVVMSNACVIQ